MKQPEQDCAGDFFSTLMLGAFAVCLAWLCFHYILLPVAAEDGLPVLEILRARHLPFG